jgi:predicted nucleic acid-binding protein
LNFVDTNIFIYSLLPKQDPNKHAIAVNLLHADDLVLSTQVVNELGAALRSKHAVPDREIRRIVEDIYFRYEVVEINRDDIFATFFLRERFKISYWDSFIVATAIRTDAKFLYSEDMQHGLRINDQLTIRNPFL